MLEILTVEEKRRAKLVLVMMVIMAMLETLGVASVMPFVAVLSNREIVGNNEYLSALYSELEFNSIDSFILFLGVVILVIFITSLAFKALTMYAITYFSTMRQHAISCRLLNIYMRQPYEYFLGRNTAELGKTILSEVEQVTSNLMLPVMRMIAGVIVSIALIGLLLYIDVIVSIFIALLLGGSYYLTYQLTKSVVKKIGEERLQANSRRFILANEILNGVKELKLLGRIKFYIERFIEPSRKYARHQATNKIVASIPHYAIQAVIFGGMLGVVLFMIKQHGDFNESLPFIALFAFAGYRLIPAFQDIFSNLTMVRFTIPVLNSLHQEINHMENYEYSTENYCNKDMSLRSSLILRNVSYRYPSSRYEALKNISLTINAGQSIGFVGSTGAGKSTIVDVILGLLVPDKGELLLDGEKIDKTSLRDWQNNIGYVPQDVYLADDTIMANIAFGIPYESIDENAVARAAKIAHIHEFINSELPLRYKTVIGEKGIRLSGGQKQRLAIARALYHDPDVVVFDEATSALDNATEKIVMEAIGRLQGSKTTILIAHRLTTLENCNCIFMLEKGNLVDSGDFDTLMSESVSFRKLAASSKGN